MYVLPVGNGLEGRRGARAAATTWAARGRAQCMSTARAAGLGDQEERAGGGLHQEKLDEDERLPAEIGERMGLVTRGDGGTSDGEDLHTRRHSWLVRHDRWEARAWRRLGSGQSQKPSTPTDAIMRELTAGPLRHPRLRGTRW